MVSLTLYTRPGSISQPCIELRTGSDSTTESWNHLTLMVPGAADRFLVKAHGLLMNEITASNLIMADVEGNVVEGNGELEQSAFCIHSQIHLGHPNANCVLHAHPPHATWLADVLDGRLEMVNQDNLRFYGRIAYDDDYSGPADDVDEGARMAKAFDGKPVLVSRNHGVTTTGATVADAFYNLYYLEVACKRQHLLCASRRHCFDHLRQHRGSHPG